MDDFLFCFLYLVFWGEWGRGEAIERELSGGVGKLEV